jgi:uncharacterized protein
MRPRRLALLLAVPVVLALPTAASAQAPAAPTDGTPTLAVVGQGIASVTPDTADVTASVTKTATTTAAAREDVARRTTALLRTLDGLGVPRADITTTSVSIARETRRRAPKVHFTATVSIAVHLTDVSRAGAVLDALTAAGADDVNGPSFGFSQPSSGAPQAEQAALADARARADAAAAAVGLRVVGVRSIDLDPGQGSVVATAKGGGSAGTATPTPVPVGSQRVSASVAVVFVLG